MDTRSLSRLTLRAGALTLSIGLAAGVVYSAHERANDRGTRLDPGSGAGAGDVESPFLLGSKSGVVVPFDQAPVGPVPPGASDGTFLDSSSSFFPEPAFTSLVELDGQLTDPTFFSSSKMLAPTDVTPIVQLLSPEHANLFQTVRAER